MKITKKGQVSIPKEIREAMRLKPGDEVDFRIEGNNVIMVPVKTIRIPRDQEWFWTKEWQTKEKEADEALKKGKYKEFDDVEDLLKDLHS